MPDDDKRSRPVHENLDTAYVNLAALLRYLQQRDFSGRVHVELDEYTADIFLSAGSPPRAREMNHATGREEEGEAALQRLLVRAREAGGLVSVYEGAHEDLMEGEPWGVSMEGGTTTAQESEAGSQGGLLHLCGELIAAVERAVLVAGGDFAAAFHAARLGLADDYPFLDPMTRRFEYADGVVRLQAEAGDRLIVSGVSEALRRAVERVATGEHRIGVRRDVARELSTLKRRRQTALERYKFMPQLERIAGMRLL